MREVYKARIFKNGGSQAIRIPAQWRFDSEEVFVRFDEQMNALVITERDPKPMQNFFALASQYGAPDQDWPELAPETHAPVPGWLQDWLDNEK